MTQRDLHDVVKDQEPVTVPPTQMIRVVCRSMAEHNIGSVLVCENNHVVGIFTERDALVRVLAAGLNPDTTPIADVMSTRLMALTPDRSVVDALRLMQEHGFRHIPVVEKGLPLGVISMRDALGRELACLQGELEEKEAIAEILG